MPRGNHRSFGFADDTPRDKRDYHVLKAEPTSIRNDEQDLAWVMRLCNWLGIAFQRA